MTYEIINVGLLPNDGKGDTLQVAFEKINNNFKQFGNLIGLTPQLVVIGPSKNGEPADTYRTAVDKLNNNFTSLFAETTLVPVTFSVKDSMRTTFERINIVFEKLYEVLVVPTVTPVEVIEPTEQVAQTEVINDASYVGNINITNYNFYVNSTEPISNTALPAPTPAKLQPLTTSPIIVGPYGNQELINVGAAPNDGTGDPLRVAFQKINNNFSNLFYTTSTTSTEFTAGPAPNQVIFEVPITEFTQGTFMIRSEDIVTGDSQDITLAAQLTNRTGIGVKFTGYGTTFEGNVICRYDMDVVNSNVRVLINPLADLTISHFISADITYQIVTAPGMYIELDGYSTGDLMVTESGLFLTTEQES